MKIAVIVVRVLLGLLFIYASVVVLFNLITPPPPTGNVKTFMEGLMATQYFFKLLKITELLCGIAFVSGRFVPLATIVIFPIALNIFLFHCFMAPEGLPTAIFVMCSTLFLAYAHREYYTPLLKPK